MHTVKTLGTVTLMIPRFGGEFSWTDRVERPRSDLNRAVDTGDTSADAAFVCRVRARFRGVDDRFAPIRCSVSAPLLLSRCAADVTLDGGIAGSSSCACSSVTPRPCAAIASNSFTLMHTARF